MKNHRQIVFEYIEEYYPEEEILIPDGMEAAFVGIANQFNTPFAVFNRQKCLQILMEDGMTYEEALEYFDFNVQGAYLGDGTPAFMDFFEFEEEPKQENKSTKHIAEQFELPL